MKLYIFWFLHQTTTYLFNSLFASRLYIFWFLHQTTTTSHLSIFLDCCISFDSYIKPQLYRYAPQRKLVVYLLIPTSNHNAQADQNKVQAVVYLLIPTSNHNCASTALATQLVVYLLIPTSNHNFRYAPQRKLELYIFWFLHQTTTSKMLLIITWKLYIFWFLHQTTTNEKFYIYRNNTALN